VTPPEPADEARTQRRKGRLNAGTSRESVPPAKRAGWRQMKPNQKKKLGAPDLSRERTSHPLESIINQTHQRRIQKFKSKSK